MEIQVLWAWILFYCGTIFVTSQKVRVYFPIQYPGGHAGLFCLPELFENLSIFMVTI